MKKLLACSLNMGLALAAVVALCLPAAEAQTYPSTHPVYIPTATLSAQTLSAPGSVVYQANGLGTVTFRLSGTFTGLTATVQGSNDRSASPVWTNLSAIPVGTPGKPVPAGTNLTAAGLWKVNTLGLAQVQVVVGALSTGAVVVQMAGTPQWFHAPGNVDLGALVTNTAQAAGTVASPDQPGADVTTVTCTFNQTANTAGSTVFSIQNKDAASGLYTTLVTSAAVTTANNAPSSIAAGAGVQASANVSSSLPIAATWRVSETASGTSTTGTIGCNAH